ncbi:MAG: cysteine--tRNA ligase [Candidatus Levybacteria bacterium]|nr:cysteine--tRNA ligase [Candidatus Levybacteria bacterium]
MKLYNSLTRQKEVFIPKKKDEVTMYVCGITPNNATHLGHAFTYVVFDTLTRFLRFKGLNIKYLQNATDINDGDDVIKQAKESGKTWEEVADMWIDHFKKQMKELHVLEPTYYIKASSAIPKIIEINKSLIEKGIAYEREGNVYFDISRDTSYGELCHFSKEQMLTISKERGNNPDDPKKKNPLDFVLWLAASEKPYWKSPWGYGRPGWHIECSAMIHDYLGEQIDIHGGGRDLIFPHHESEIAQSESYTDKKPYVKTWMHTAMVLYQGEKMSKSLGNLVLVADLLKKYNPFVIRWTLLSHHYRDPWEFREEELGEIEKKLQHIQTIEKAGHIHEDTDTNNEYLQHFLRHMEDDLDTPNALNALLSLTKNAQNETNSEKKNAMCAALHAGLAILGFKD